MIKKILTFVLILGTLPTLALTPVLAQEFTQGDNVTLAKDQTIDGDYFAAGGQVNMSGTVSGDAYVAGGNVLVDGTINNDLLVAGGTVTVQGHIVHDLRVVGGNVTVSGQVDGNVTAVGGTVQIDKSAKLGGSLVSAGGNINVLAPVTNGATISGGQVTVANTVGGNLVAATGQLTLAANAVVNGDLKYWSRSNAAIDPSAKVTGNTFHYTTSDSSMSPVSLLTTATAASLPFKVISFLAALIVGLLFIKFLPRVTHFSYDIATARPWASLGVGLLAIILVPFAFLVLLITVIGIPIAFVLLMLFAIELYLSHIIVSFIIGKKIFQWLNTTVKDWQAFAAGLLIYSIVTLIPILGGLLWILAGLFGLGALLLTKRALYREFAAKKLI